MRQEGFTVWVTGPDQRSVAAIAEAVGARLMARHVPLEVLDEHTPGISVLAGNELAVRIVFVARLLARHGIATVIGVPASGEVRGRARSELGRLIEVYVRREDVPAGLDYEPPERPEVEIVVPDPAGTGVARTLRTLEVLQLLPPDQDRAYSDEEEREVIRRLKAFGYL